jgi:hypothetical protein
MKDSAAAAIKEITDARIGTGVRTKEDADGGAYVIVDGIQIGDSFSPSTSWIGFHILWTCPDDDVYPHFADPGLKYVGSNAAPNQHPDGNLPAAISRGGTMPGFDFPAIQISRRSNHRNAETDSALQKLLRVIEFLRSH